MGTKSPLEGRGVAVTRGEQGEGPLSRLLGEKGAHVLDWGSVGFAPPEDVCPLLGALARVSDYDWICFSSPRAVDAVVSRKPDFPDGVKIAAVGPSTALSLSEAGWAVHRLPEAGNGEGLVEAFRKAGDAEGARVFFPASEIARDVIPEGLAGLGAEVDRITAYRMVTLPVDVAGCRASVEGGEVHVVTFASPSAMEAFRNQIEEDLFNALREEIPAATMGPTTASALEEVGWKKVAVARTPTLEGLVAAAEEAVS
jgi:uroporphyrinogen III methyltransferase/synthase